MLYPSKSCLLTVIRAQFEERERVEGNIISFQVFFKLCGDFTMTHLARKLWKYCGLYKESDWCLNGLSPHWQLVSFDRSKFLA